MWNLIAVLAFAVAAPADDTATKLDGTAASGQLQSWSSDTIVLKTADGTQSIPVADLLSLQFSSESMADSGKPLLVLVDGSVLPVADFTTATGRATVRLQRPSPADPSPLVFPLDKVRAVRWQELVAEVLPQWQEIRGLGLPSDLVVVLKRGGKSLDYLECIIGEVSDAEVEFTLDEKKIRVPRSKIAGLIYYRSEDELEAAAPYVLLGRDGLRIAAISVQWQDETFRATTATGLQVAWPLAGITSIDLSAGKIVFLSDLEPATARWQPLVALPSAASHAAKYGQPRFNQSVHGGPLTLAFPDAPPSTGSGETKSFAKGLALRSRSELVYRLPHGYGRFMAVAGIDPAAASNGNVMLSIFGDDRLLTESAIAGSDAPLALELDIAGVKRLKIVVAYGQNLDTGDWLNLCNARIVK